MELTRNAVLPALACLALTGPAAVTAEDSPPMELYVGLAGEFASAGLDPADYAGFPPLIDGRRDSSGAAGLYVGVRRGRLGLEAGWMFDQSVSWREAEAGLGGTETVHTAEVRSGGPYLAGLVEVLSFAEASVFVKGGVARGQRSSWRTVDGERLLASGRGGGGAILLTGAGARLALLGTGLDLRAEVLWHHDSDAGTRPVLRTGLGWRF